MIEGRVIQDSSSPWAAPIALVWKKCGAWRFCVDYRKLNNITQNDAFPLHYRGLFDKPEQSGVEW